MQIKGEVVKGKAESGGRGRKDLKVVEVEFTPMLEVGGRLKQVYDILLSPRLHEGENKDTEE